MSITVRRANLDSERDQLLSMFRQYLSPDYGSDRFDTLYRQNPNGGADAWVATEGSTGAIIGAGAAFPRKLYFSGRERLGCVLGDFCMHAEYRSLGPSLLLQKACISTVQQPPFEFFYDFPSQAMMAVYARLGIGAAFSFVRWAKPVFVQSKVAARGPKALAGSLERMSKKVLAVRGWKGPHQYCEIKEQTRFDSKLDEFLLQLGRLSGIQTACSLEYLNWRYFSKFEKKHRLLVAWRGAKVVGLVVYVDDPSDATIVDAKVTADENALANLLAAAVDKLRMRGAQTVSLFAVEGHPWSQLFQSCGFKPRETAPLIVHCNPHSGIQDADFSDCWFAMRGERDS